MPSEDVTTEYAKVMGEAIDAAARANPWLRDDNRYTFDAISTMSRPEFERRTE